MVKKLLFVACLLPSVVMAYEININGFANYSYGQHDHNIKDSNKGYLVYEGIDRNAKMYDSSAGIIFTSNLNNKWATKVQLLGTNNPSTKSHDVKLDIYQLSYDYSSNIKFRFGRIRTTTWMFSEVLQVGALYPWMYTPIEVYGKNPLKAFMGGMASFGFDTTNSTQLWLDIYQGSESTRIYSNNGSDVDLSARDLLGFNLTWGNEFYSIRASQLKGFLTGEIVTPYDTTVSSVTARLKLPNDFNLKNTTFRSFGAKYNKGNILALSEYATVKSDSSLYKNAIAHYITLGYYFFDRKYLFHITSSSDDKREADAYPSLERSTAFGLNYQLNSSIILKSEFKTVSVDEKKYPGTAAAGYQDAQNRSQNMNLYPDRHINVFSLGLAAVF